MHAIPRAVVAASTALAGIGAAATAGAAADDQANADAAMEVFNTRMTDAAWTSHGPPDPGDFDDEDLDDLDECFAGIVELLDAGGAAVDGETARAYSDRFGWSPETDDTATTDLLTFVQEETVEAFIVTVDQGSSDGLATIIDTIASDKTATCLEEAFIGQWAATSEPPSDDSPTPEFTVSAEAEPDLGIGDQSGRLSFVLVVDMFDTTIAFGASFSIARVDRSLVGVSLSYSTPESLSAFDPDEELAAIVDSLGG